jgi:hypothetical protein
MTPYLAALVRRRRIIDRPDRPSSIVAPNRNLRTKNSRKRNGRHHPAAAAPPRRRNQMARVGLLTELGVSAPRARA